MKKSAIAFFALVLPPQAWALSIQPNDWGGFSYDTDVMCSTFLDTEQIGVVKKDDKYGLADSTGKVLIPLDYDDGVCLSDGHVAFLRQGKWGVLDGQHRVVVPFIFDKKISDFNGKDQLIITDNGSDGSYSTLYATDGQVLLEHQRGRLRFERGGLIRFEGDDNGQSGFMDSTGKVILMGHYDWVKLLDAKAGDERFLVSLNNHTLMMDRHKTVLAQGYDNIEPFDEHGISRVYQNSTHRYKVGFVDRSGRLIVRPSLHEYPIWNEVFGHEWQLRTDGTSCTLFLQDRHDQPVNDPEFPDKSCQLLAMPNEPTTPVKRGFWGRFWDRIWGR